MTEPDYTAHAIGGLIIVGGLVSLFFWPAAGAVAVVVGGLVAHSSGVAKYDRWYMNHG